MSDTHIRVFPRKVYGLPGIYGEMEEYGLVKVNYPYVFSTEDGRILTCLDCDSDKWHCDEHCPGCYDCVGEEFLTYYEENYNPLCHCEGGMEYCPDCQPDTDEVPF